MNSNTKRKQDENCYKISVRSFYILKEQYIGNEYIQ